MTMCRFIPSTPLSRWLLVVVLAGAILAMNIFPAEAARRYYKKSGSKHSSSHKVGKTSSKKSKNHARGKYKRKRYACNTTVGKQQAFALLQSSRDLALLASLDYRPDPALIQNYIANDKGELSDDELEEAGVDADSEIDGDSTKFTADAYTLHKLWFSYISTVDSVERNALYEENFVAGSIGKREIMRQILAWIGTSYWYGGVSRSGIDCSAFTRAVYRASGDIELPRTAAMQSTVGEHVRQFEDLRFGDLVFFNTRSRVYVSHVGLYLGDNLFAHASSRYGVTVSSLRSDYYQTRFLGAKRLRPEDLQTLATTNRNFSSLFQIKNIRTAE